MHVYGKVRFYTIDSSTTVNHVMSIMIMIIYNRKWSILIQYIRIILSGNNLT